MKQNSNYDILNTTLGYLEKDGCYLMLHRTRKKNDISHDKWIGIGGKMEAGETVLACMQRECREETGLHWHDPCLRGIISFNFRRHSEDPAFHELMFLYTGSHFSGQLKDCEEGELVWVPKTEIPQLPLWKGDQIFFALLEERSDLFYLQLDYVGDALVYASVDGKIIEESIDRNH